MKVEGADDPSRRRSRRLNLKALERFEFMSLVFWVYRTSIQSNWEFIIN
jgi:CMP-2-keto-3-deoxyoctulosonic acid synthetase